VQAISQVIREDKADSVIRAMVTMQRLQKAAANGFAPCDTSSNRHHRHGAYIASPAVELANVGKTFDALDKDNSGDIDCGELRGIFEKLGLAVTDICLTKMVTALDTNKDGTISKTEFLDFYKAHVVCDLDHHQIHKLGEDLFALIDTDGSGEITLSEFKDVLLSFNVGFSIDEIGDMANEIDGQDNGTIHEHEFVKFLFSHEHLFERCSLPSLE